MGGSLQRTRITVTSLTSLRRQHHVPPQAASRPSACSITSFRMQLHVPPHAASRPSACSIASLRMQHHVPPHAASRPSACSITSLRRLWGVAPNGPAAPGRRCAHPRPPLCDRATPWRARAGRTAPSRHGSPILKPPGRRTPGTGPPSPRGSPPWLHVRPSPRVGLRPAPRGPEAAHQYQQECSIIRRVVRPWACDESVSAHLRVTSLVCSHRPASVPAGVLHDAEEGVHVHPAAQAARHLGDHHGQVLRRQPHLRAARGEGQSLHEPASAGGGGGGH